MATTLHCDICGKAYRPDLDADEALTIVFSDGWHGGPEDQVYCPECVEQSEERSGTIPKAP